MSSAIRIGIAAIISVPSFAQQAKVTAASPGQKQKISYSVPATNIKYTQQYTIDVGDVSGHQIRIFELHRTFPAAAGGATEGTAKPPSTGSSADGPVFNGVRATESWTRAFSDYVDANGPVFGYIIFAMENSEKIFARYDGLSQTQQGGKTNTPIVLSLTGGTDPSRAFAA